MVKIKLKRLGAKKRPVYKFVVADARSARNGKVIAELGNYNPMSESETLALNIDTEALNYWLSKGAQPTEAVGSLLKRIKPN